MYCVDSRTLLSIFAIAIACALSAAAGDVPAPKPIPEIYQEYRDYKPSFLNYFPKDKKGEWGNPMGVPAEGWYKDPDEMKLSSEPSFFTLSSAIGLCMDDEMDGYVKVAKGYEAAGNYR